MATGSYKVAGLEQRRGQRLEQRKRRLMEAGAAIRKGTYAERIAMLDYFKNLPIGHLRAVHKAALQHFPKP